MTAQRTDPGSNARRARALPWVLVVSCGLFAPCAIGCGAALPRSAVRSPGPRAVMAPSTAPSSSRDTPSVAGYSSAMPVTPGVEPMDAERGAGRPSTEGEADDLAAAGAAYDALVAMDARAGGSAFRAAPEALSAGTDCALVCETSERVCELAERVCAIASRYPEDGELSLRCRDGAARCERGRQRAAAACGCASPR